MAQLVGLIVSEDDEFKKHTRPASALGRHSGQRDRRSGSRRDGTPPTSSSSMSRGDATSAMSTHRAAARRERRERAFLPSRSPRIPI